MLSQLELEMLATLWRDLDVMDGVLVIGPADCAAILLCKDPPSRGGLLTRECWSSMVLLTAMAPPCSTAPSCFDLC